MKTELTTQFEKELMKGCILNRTFGVTEVTIGWYGRKRVDFVEVNTKGDIKCYEIKVTKSDFHSKHGHNFVGHYNYYVMPKSLYDEVKDEIPDDVGVLVEGLKSVKKCKRKYIRDAEYLKLYIIRSMSREVKKAFESEDVAELTYWKSRAKFHKQKANEYYSQLTRARRRRRCK